jgi:drug/metabolite transporter (DMT)-like permease
MTAYVIALACVVSLAAGQVLFKMSASSLAQSGTTIAPAVAVTFLAAMFLYGISSIAWVWVLQRLELGRVYPLMALAFVLVPLASHFVFGERFHFSYFVGVGLIVLGIIVVALS